MSYYTALDVSLRSVSICIIDDKGDSVRPNACSVPQELRADCGKKRDPRGDEPDQRKKFDLDKTARLKKRTLVRHFVRCWQRTPGSL